MFRHHYASLLISYNGKNIHWRHAYPLRLLLYSCRHHHMFDACRIEGMPVLYYTIGFNRPCRCLFFSHAFADYASAAKQIQKYRREKCTHYLPQSPFHGGNIALLPAPFLTITLPREHRALELLNSGLSDEHYIVSAAPPNRGHDMPRTSPPFSAKIPASAQQFIVFTQCQALFGLHLYTSKSDAYLRVLYIFERYFMRFSCFIYIYDIYRFRETLF